ncbi:hypothetical protein Tco_0391053 [Tanacetum coccineum]
MGSANTIMHECTESGEERFKKFTNNSCVIGGERFLLQPNLIYNQRPRWCICWPLDEGNGPIKSMPQTSKIITDSGRNMRHLITNCEIFSIELLWHYTRDDHRWYHYGKAQRMSWASLPKNHNVE